jgi:hypothetical protein
MPPNNPNGAIPAAAISAFFTVDTYSKGILFGILI